jgi:rubrerythrin
MNFNHTVMATELQGIQQRENAMYKLYDQLLKEISNPMVKERLRFIRDQELGHVRMCTEIISILREHIIRG